MSKINELFTEKFRPQNLDQLIAPERIKSLLNKGVVQNILLEGPPGTGKTSTAFILAKNHPHLYINASEERGIDTVREKITKFASTISLEGGHESIKVIILDEFDGGTNEFFDSLRPVIERYSKIVRFIGTCNYVHKIPEPIRDSRFHTISFYPINKEEEDYLIKEYAIRVSKILTAANISFNKEILIKFVKNDFPDMRALMNKIQSMYLRGIKELDISNFNTNFDFQNLFNICLDTSKEPYQNYKAIIGDYGSRVDESLAALGNDFPEYLKNVSPDKEKYLPNIIISIAKYQYQKAFVIDPQITLLACIYEIQQTLKQ